jgi:hypothetical protein
VRELLVVADLQMAIGVVFQRVLQLPEILNHFYARIGW